MLSIFRDYYIPSSFKPVCSGVLNIGVFAAVTKTLFDLNVGARIGVHLHSNLDNRQVSLLTAGTLAGFVLVFFHNSKKTLETKLEEKDGEIGALKETNGLQKRKLEEKDREIKVFKKKIDDLEGNLHYIANFRKNQTCPDEDRYGYSGSESGSEYESGKEELDHSWITNDDEIFDIKSINSSN